MFSISENPVWLMTASGDAVKLNYVKKIYVWYQGFGPGKKFQVRADVDGGAKGDEPVILAIFDNQEGAKEFIKKLIIEN